jgi:hypothetical protein
MGDPVLRNRDAVASSPPAELRFYWSPARRVISWGYPLFALVVLVSILASRGFTKPAWIGVVAIAVVVMGTAMMFRMGWVSGVYESGLGVQWRSGSPLFRRESGDAAWADIRGFGYAKLTPLSTCVYVVRIDGTRRLMSCATPQMRWRHGGWTGDFVQLLNERALAFGAPIDGTLE